MGESIGDRLREVAGRLDEAGEDLKAGAKAALSMLAARLEAIADKIEAGEDVDESAADEDADEGADEGAPRPDNTLPGEQPSA